MTLIDDLSGKKGENLSSAMLAHILLRSEPVRRAVTDKISDKSPIGPIVVSKHFSVFTEVSTDERKRIDILLQTDDAVVGIENKFGADFQDGQPEGYLGLVEETANGLQSVWRTTYQPLLIVLAPAQREDEIQQHIGKIDDVCAFLAWEELLRSLDRNNLPELAAVDRFLVDELDRFVKSNTGSVEIARLARHIDKPWQPRGSAVVREFYNHVIWPTISDELLASYSYGGGNAYYGYYLAAHSDSETWTWFGFMDRAEVSNESRSGAALIAAFLDRDASARLLRESDTTRVHPASWKSHICVELEYSTGWKDRSEWEELVRKLNRSVQETACKPTPSGA